VSTPSLRERKKQQTRRAIADAARRLFAERGFEGVTVAEIAREADVSEGTVFNYFPTKEDLFYSGMESFEAALLDAVRARPAGESVLAAFRRFVLEQSSGLSERAEVIEAAARLIDSSPALQAREREIDADYTTALAELLAEETRAGPDDVEPRVVAAALMGAQRALVADVRASILAGVRGQRLMRSLRTQLKRGFARLEAGLADYDVKRE
jgi:AcrR family transcriptional regulator